MADRVKVGDYWVHEPPTPAEQVWLAWVDQVALVSRVAKRLGWGLELPLTDAAPASFPQVSPMNMMQDGGIEYDFQVVLIAGEQRIKVTIHENWGESDIEERILSIGHEPAKDGI